MIKKKDEIAIIKTLQSCNDFGNANEYYSKLKTMGENFQDNENLQMLINIAEALGKEDRLFILHALKDKDRCVCELEAILQKSQPAVSHHLRILENANLIRGWKKGKFTHYSLIKPKFDKFNQLISEFSDSIANWFGKISV